MEVSGQLHGPAALPRQGIPLSIDRTSTIQLTESPYRVGNVDSHIDLTYYAIIYCIFVLGGGLQLLIRKQFLVNCQAICECVHLAL
jgi:hypothetical protein